MTKVSKFPFRLAQGYRDFLVGRMPTERERYRVLATRGQSPNVMVIGCCDSRVSPEVIFDAHPGELFVLVDGNHMSRYQYRGNGRWCHHDAHILLISIQMHPRLIAHWLYKFLKDLLKNSSLRRRIRAVIERVGRSSMSVTDARVEKRTIKPEK